MKNAAQLVKSRLPNLKKVLTQLQSQEVLIGVPADRTVRKDDPINNATLLYIHENGAPASNIPARPTLRPGVEAAKDKIAKYMGDAGKKWLSTSEEISADLNRAGKVAVNSVRNQFVNLAPPLKPNTILNRSRARGTKSKRKSELAFAEAMKFGADPEAAQTILGIQPLVNTGQLRNSITYVIRKR